MDEERTLVGFFKEEPVSPNVKTVLSDLKSKKEVKRKKEKKRLKVES